MLGRRIGADNDRGRWVRLTATIDEMGPGLTLVLSGTSDHSKSATHDVAQPLHPTGADSPNEVQRSPEQMASATAAVPRR